MTDTPRPWDRLTAESDPAFAAYLDTGSLRDAYRQRSGKAQATSAPGAWTGWSTKYNWVSRRAAFVEFTVRECQDAIQIGLVQIRKRLIDAANELLDDGGVPAVRAASRVIVENFPPLARVADVSDGEQIEDLSDIPDEALERMREIRDAARARKPRATPSGMRTGKDQARNRQRTGNGCAALRRLPVSTGHFRGEARPVKMNLVRSELRVHVEAVRAAWTTRS